ncbi:hypothetical protein ACJX0J_026010 [Zea mays]
MGFFILILSCIYVSQEWKIEISLIINFPHRHTCRPYIKRVQDRHKESYLGILFISMLVYWTRYQIAVNILVTSWHLSKFHFIDKKIKSMLKELYKYKMMGFSLHAIPPFFLIKKSDHNNFQLSFVTLDP